MMRKLSFIVFLLILFTSCKGEKGSDYATISGKITYPNSDFISIKGNGYKKTIKVNQDGTFSDTLHLENKSNHYLFTDGNEELIVYLKNKDYLKITANTNDFLKTINFDGIGSDTNNYLSKKALIGRESFTKNFFNLDEDEFDTQLQTIFSKFKTLLTKYPNMDRDLYKLETKELKDLKDAVKGQYNRNKLAKNKFSSLEGKMAPQFTDYVNYKGGTSSLKDFKGKYIFMDIWATWCTPCRKEIPFLQQLEKDFKGKNIVFISVSIDKIAAMDAWKAMIKSHNMSGVQLFAYGDKTFIEKLLVDSVPRFLIIDPEGKIIKAQTSRPSNPKTKELLNKLLK